MAAGLTPVLNADRPTNSAGAVTFHFEYRAISRGDGADDGKAQLHQRYITRDANINVDVEKKISLEEIKSIREKYLAREGAVEMNAGSHNTGPLAPFEARFGFSMFGNIGVDASDREYFWRAVEKIEPKNMRGTLRLSSNLGAAELSRFVAAIDDGAIQHIVNKGWITIKVADRKVGEALINRLRTMLSIMEPGATLKGEFTPGKSGRIQHRIIAELAHELTPEQRYQVVARFVEQKFAAKKFPYFAVIHRPGPEGDQRNTHAHIDFYDRPCGLNAKGYWDFEDPETRQRKDRDAARQGWVMDLRKEFCRVQNEVLAEAGLKKRYFAESYYRAGIAQTPTIHLGPKVHALETQGVQTDRGAVAARAELSRQTISKKARAAEAEIWDTAVSFGFSRDEIEFRIEERSSDRARELSPVTPTLDLAADFVELSLAHEGYLEARRQEMNRARRLLGTFDFRERNLKERIERLKAQPLSTVRGHADGESAARTAKFRLSAMTSQLAEIPKLRADAKRDHEERWKQLEDQKPHFDNVAAQRRRLEVFFASSQDVTIDRTPGARDYVFHDRFDRLTGQRAYDESMARTLANAQIGGATDDSKMQYAYETTAAINDMQERARQRARAAKALKPQIDARIKAMDDMLEFNRQLGPQLLAERQARIAAHEARLAEEQALAEERERLQASERVFEQLFDEAQQRDAKANAFHATEHQFSQIPVDIVADPSASAGDWDSAQAPSAVPARAANPNTPPTDQAPSQKPAARITVSLFDKTEPTLATQPTVATIATVAAQPRAPIRLQTEGMPARQPAQQPITPTAAAAATPRSEIRLQTEGARPTTPAQQPTAPTATAARAEIRLQTEGMRPTVPSQGSVTPVTPTAGRPAPTTPKTLAVSLAPKAPAVPTQAPVVPTALRLPITDLRRELERQYPPSRPILTLSYASEFEASILTPEELRITRDQARPAFGSQPDQLPNPTDWDPNGQAADVFANEAMKLRAVDTRIQMMKEGAIAPTVNMVTVVEGRLPVKTGPDGRPVTPQRHEQILDDVQRSNEVTDRSISRVLQNRVPGFVPPQGMDPSIPSQAPRAPAVPAAPPPKAPAAQTEADRSWEALKREVEITLAIQRQNSDSDPEKM